jgi:hypothetical protein
MIGSKSRAACLIASAALFLGCAGSTAGARDPNAARPGGPVRPVAVSDEEFAERTYQLLLDAEPSPERDNLLVGS